MNPIKKRIRTEASNPTSSIESSSVRCLKTETLFLATTWNKCF